MGNPLRRPTTDVEPLESSCREHATATSPLWLMEGDAEESPYHVDSCQGTSDSGYDCGFHGAGSCGCESCVHTNVNHLTSHNTFSVDAFTHGGTSEETAAWHHIEKGE